MPVGHVGTEQGDLSAARTMVDTYGTDSAGGFMLKSGAPTRQTRRTKCARSDLSSPSPSPRGEAPPASPPTYKVPKFLRSLYSILQTEDPNVVAWVQNHELKPNRVTAFHILDMKRFEREVLPKYFKHQKFASFQRQLNNFGFRKWTKTQSSGVCTFSHNCFPPDPQLIGAMRASLREQWRQKKSTTGPSTGSPARKRTVQHTRSKSGKSSKHLAPTAAAIKAAGMAASPADIDCHGPPSPKRPTFRSPMNVVSFNELLHGDSGTRDELWPHSKHESSRERLDLPILKYAKSSSHTIKPFSIGALHAMSSSNATSSPSLVECSISLASFPSYNNRNIHSEVIPHEYHSQVFETTDRPAADVSFDSMMDPWHLDTQSALSFEFPPTSFELDLSDHLTIHAPERTFATSSHYSGLLNESFATSDASSSDLHRSEQSLPMTNDTTECGLDSLLFVE